MEILKIAEVLKENELLLGEIYSECQKFFPGHAKFFESLENEEKGHARLIEKIISDMVLNPDSWQIGKMSFITANNVNKQIKEALSEMRSEQVSKKYALTFAISMELSLSEKKFSRIFINESKVFKDAMQKLEDGFEVHYAKLLEVNDKIFAKRNLV